MLTMKYYQWMLFNKVQRWLRKVIWEKLRHMLRIGKERWRLTLLMKNRLICIRIIIKTLKEFTIWYKNNIKKRKKMMMDIIVEICKCQVCHQWIEIKLRKKNQRSRIKKDSLVRWVIKLVLLCSKHRTWTLRIWRNNEIKYNNLFIKFQLIII
jgi:hypothetical protein